MTKLSERTMLVSLHIGTYSGMMFDKEATEGFNESMGADAKKAGRYNKRLINSDFLKDVGAAHNAARKIHRLLTLPWDDDGTRILTTKGYMNYTKMLKDCRIKSEDEVKAFLTRMPDAINEAKVRLGDLFNADDYPDGATLAEKFSFDVEIKPMPESGDFRAQLSDDAVKAVVKDIERRSNKRIQAAMRDVFGRVADLVRRMSERLRAYQPTKAGEDGKKRSSGVFRDSVVYDIHEMVEMLPSLNVTDDPRIDELVKQLASELVEHSPEILRVDAKARQQTISKADAILKKVERYMK